MPCPADSSITFWRSLSMHSQDIGRVSLVHRPFVFARWFLIQKKSTGITPRCWVLNFHRTIYNSHPNKKSPLGREKRPELRTVHYISKRFTNKRFALWWQWRNNVSSTKPFAGFLWSSGSRKQPSMYYLSWVIGDGSLRENRKASGRKTDEGLMIEALPDIPAKIRSRRILNFFFTTELASSPVDATAWNSWYPNIVRFFPSSVLHGRFTSQEIDTVAFKSVTDLQKCNLFFRIPAGWSCANVRWRTWRL